MRLVAIVGCARWMDGWNADDDNFIFLFFSTLVLYRVLFWGGFGVRGLKWHRSRDRKDRCAGKEEKEGGETI